MLDNPFSNYEIRIPRAYSEQVKRFCSMSGGELTPFERQVDFWYFAFLYAVKNKLRTTHYEPKDMVNVVSASILIRDPYRISHMQAAYLSLENDIDGLANDKKVFDFVAGLANSGIPHVIQILSDSDNKPLWNILDSIESSLS